MHRPKRDAEDRCSATLRSPRHKCGDGYRSTQEIPESGDSRTQASLVPSSEGTDANQFGSHFTPVRLRGNKQKYGKRSGPASSRRKTPEVTMSSQPTEPVRVL